MRMFVVLLSVSLFGSSGALAAPVERRLHIAQAEASSFDKNDYNRFEENYLPLYVADDDPTTAWTEGAAGDGVGEWLRVRFSAMKGATKVRLRIRNGYQKSKKLFAANERAKKVSFKLLPGGSAVDKELADQDGWQEVVLEQPAGPLSGVEMSFGEVFAGKKYQDLCISDVQVFVTADTPDNPAFEKAVLDRVKKWKSDRVSAAKTFAQAARERPLPISSRYDLAVDKDSKDWQRGEDAFAPLEHLDTKRLGPEEKKVLAAVRGWIDKRDTAFEGVSLSTAGQAKLPAVDGLCVPQLGTCSLDFCDQPMAPFDGLPLVTTDQFKVIEMKDRPAFSSVVDHDGAKKVKGCNSNDGATLAWAVREGPERRTRALVVMRCGLVEGREGRYVASSLQLLAYDDKGRLRLTVNPFGATSFSWKGEGNAAMIDGGSYLTLGSSGKFSATTVLSKQ
jgi:hypothetical protein